MIVTFYSYKGGVGRSMALANIGTWLYRKGHRVLLVDWDLEAPGLESFFFHDDNSLNEIRSRSGLIDLIDSYLQLWGLDPTSGESLSDATAKANTLTAKLGGFQHLLIPLDKTEADTISTRHPGLWLLHAGCRSGLSETYYTRTVNAMEWGRFYAEFGGFVFLEWFRQQVEKDFDLVLIDSRTGITEMGGVCTQHLADMALLMFAPNYSNLYGVRKISEILLDPKLKNLRGNGRPISVYPIPARVDMQGATNKLKDFEKQFKKEFSRFKQIDVNWCWDSIIPYVSTYSYEEEILFTAPSPHAQMREAYERIGKQIALLHDEALVVTDRGAAIKARGARQLDQRVDVDGSRRTILELTTTAREKIDQNDLSIAENLLRSALSLAERDLDSEHPDTLRVMNMLATVLNYQRKFTAAKGLWEQLVHIYSRTHGEADPLTNAAMSNFALTLQNQGDFDHARRLFEKVLNVRRRALGEQHLDTLSSMNDLSETLSAQGHLESARSLQEQVLATRRRILGEEHPDTLTSMNNLSETLSAQGELDLARALQEKVVAARRRILGEEHPDTLKAISNMASILRFLKSDVNTASSLEKEVRDIRPEAVPTIYLSSTYEDLKDYRRVVYETLRKCGYHVIAMEDYVATDQRPIEKCFDDLAKADVYVGIFGFRYGYVPQTEKNPAGFSITELELRHAEALRKPCLTFVMNDIAGWPQSFDDAYASEDRGERIKALRHHLLMEKLSGAFSMPHELAAQVLAAVTRLLESKKEQQHSSVQQSDARVAATWNIEEKGSPYPGLMHFSRKYAPVFFGRDAETREILDRMCDPDGRFVIISGNSGVGKSSVVDAGVLAHIERIPLLGSTRCLCVRMVPSQGAGVFGALIKALHPYATRAGRDPETIESHLAGVNPESLERDLITSPQRLADHVREILSKGGGDHDALVLFLDQMEELFTAQDVDASKAFLTALYHAAREGALWVVATIRSDNLHHCYGHPDMLRLLRGKGHYPLGHIEPFMLPDLIVKPAQCAGLEITDSLVRRIIHDVGTEAGNQPLLGFVLNQLFKRRSGRELSEAVYEQLGGVQGAIANLAGEVEARIYHDRGIETSALLPRVFDSLVTVNSEGLPGRRRPLRSEFPSQMNELIDALVRERLLHLEGDQNPVVSISHEALFEAWPSLRAYIADNRKQLIDRTLLESRSLKWVEMGKPWFGGLASGREYRDFQRTGTIITSITNEYLTASHRAHWAFGITSAAIMVLFFGTAWLWQEGYHLDHALLKIQSLFISIYQSPDMGILSGGTFQQGDLNGRGDHSEQPVHEVTIKSFVIGKYEVTFEEYDRYAVSTSRPLPGDQGWGRGRRPVINVSWQDAQDYAAWLSQQTSQRYRLPTEAEWEYAARSGGNYEIWAGTSDESQLKDYAVYYKNSDNRSATVGMKKPTRRGLYDMSGNVFEWVEDCWHKDYRGAPTDGSAWLETGGGGCNGRVARGGSLFSNPEDIRSSARGGIGAVNRSNAIGFRLAHDIENP